MLNYGRRQIGEDHALSGEFGIEFAVDEGPIDVDDQAALRVANQRSAQVGVLTDLSYVQLAGSGVASIDVGFPMRYSHSAREVCDLNDLAALAELIGMALSRVTPDFSLDRDDYT